MYNNYGAMPYYQPFIPQTRNMQPQENYPQNYQQSVNNFQQQQQSYPQNYQQGLQGKPVESIDVVKALDTPLDGSTSYFPLTDGSAIITKQLKQDGTSKIVVFKSTEEPTPVKEQPKYVTEQEFQEALATEPDAVKELKEEIKALKRQIRDMTEDIKDIQKPKSKKGDD